MAAVTATGFDCHWVVPRMTSPHRSRKTGAPDERVPCDSLMQRVAVMVVAIGQVPSRCEGCLMPCDEQWMTIVGIVPLKVRSGIPITLDPLPMGGHFLFHPYSTAVCRCIAC